MKSKAIEPALDVLCSHQYFAPFEVLIIRRIAVGFQSGLDEGPLLVGKPADGSGVVRDEPVRDDSDYDCEQTFLQ